MLRLSYSICIHYNRCSETNSNSWNNYHFHLSILRITNEYLFSEQSNMPYPLSPVQFDLLWIFYFNFMFYAIHRIFDSTRICNWIGLSKWKDVNFPEIPFQFLPNIYSHHLKTTKHTIHYNNKSQIIEFD